MQGYAYSIFSIAAIAIHLIINFNLLLGRGVKTIRGIRYRGFLAGVLFYYMADAAWGILAGLGWIGPWYVDTVLFFLSLVAFVFMWCRFVVVYLGLGRCPTRILLWCGYALLAVNVVLLVANVFTDCFFCFDENGKYVINWARDPAFALLIGYNVLTAAFVLARTLGTKDSVRRRSLMVLMFCVTITLAIVLQILLPLTPFTALGCLVGNCFFHVFVIQDEQAARHMAKLEDALSRARAAEKARSLFFSIVSHDIRTPLNAILGYSEILRFGIDSQKERDEALKSIHASGTTLLQLVNDLLDLAKMDAGKIALHSEPMRLARLTDDVFASFRLAASSKGIELVNRTKDVPTVLLDEHRFRQILFNFIGNAVKFTERGSITVAASYAGGNLEVSVSDTGCGVPKDMLTHILDPFVQVQDPTHSADRAGGTGLGLAICTKMVKAMGGELLVESELGKGSTFTVRIPNVAVSDEKSEVGENSAPDTKPKQSAALANLPKKVLVVDDSPMNCSVLTAHLKKAGVTSIDKAADGVEAFSKLDAAMNAGSPYDFVFSDFWMPNMNGLELAEKIRGDSRFNGLRVYAVTADTEVRGDERHNLFNGIILKPITAEKLRAVLAQA